MSILRTDPFTVIAATVHEIAQKLTPYEGYIKLWNMGSQTEAIQSKIAQAEAQLSQLLTQIEVEQSRMSVNNVTWDDIKYPYNQSNWE